MEGFRKKALAGTFWMGSQQVLQRSISYVKLALLARLLTPAKFGIYGIASLILSLLEILTETGINAFLIQEKKEIKEYINTAWIISIVRGFIITLIIYLSAPFVSKYFNSPEALYILRLISMVPLIRGFINPSVASFLKTLNYKSEFGWRILLFGFESLVTLITAFITKSELSFIYGLLSGASLEVVLSLIFIKPNPRFVFEKANFELILRRGRWITLSGWLDYLTLHIDDIFVGKIIGTTSLGLYQNAYKISMLPITEVVNAANRVTFSIFTHIADDKKRLKKAFFKVFSVTFVCILPLVALCFFFPEIIIRILLGDAWLSAVLPLKVLSIAGFLGALNTLPNSVFLSVKRQDIIAKSKVLQLFLMGVTLIPFIKISGMLGASYSVLVSMAITLPFIYYILFKLLENRG